MKITLSKRQWQFIGRKAGWIKKAQENGWWEDVLLGNSPIEEKQLIAGSSGYEYFSKVFSQAYMDQLNRMFPDKPEDVKFSIKKKEGYYGSEYYVCLSYKSKEDIDDEENEAANYVYEIIENPPEKWDEFARQEISNN